ncbi:16S rRNA (cytosine(1402)-N(4))-methyltransferase RsmH [bacterium]|nr:16S rRNA (cytosine(1402)-N(4))-methyltransferase RsmH [bacterium]
MIEHIPVLLDEIIKYLNCMGNKVIVDCTIGEGGHAEKILENLGSSGILLGIDQDQDALVAARKRLASFGERVVLIWDNFTNLEKILKEKGIEKIDGILFDLGISSLQLNRRDRGFSFLKEGPLDMRMNKAQKINASELINKTSYKELQNIIYELGEKRWARRIARAIVRERGKGPVTTTTQLARIIERAVPYRGRIHPATRAFQALRIEVNRELENLKEILPQAVDSLRKGGRICIVSYHSLEDRIVKNSFKEFARQGRIEILTKKPIISQEEEIRMNPRSRSAKLRVGERI